MFYVSEKSLELALRMERKLSSLPPSAGVLFVAVQAQPEEGGESKEFFIRLGMVKSLTERTGKALVEQVLAEEMRSGLKIFAGVYRGVPGTCRDDGAPSARPASA